MKKKLAILGLVFGTVAISLGITFTALASTQRQRPVPVSQVSANADELRINEVAPASSAEKPAWVELTVPAQRTFLPVVKDQGKQQASAAKTAQKATPVTLTQAGTTYVLDLNGFTYRLPGELPIVPPNDFVTVILGQSGQDNLDFSDGTATLYAASVPRDALAGPGGYVGLYNSPVLTSTTILDYVAWGDLPGGDDDQAVAAGLWSPNAALQYNIGYGDDDYSEPVPIWPDESFGRFAGVWAPYRAENSSQGGPNPVPAPIYSEFQNGMAIQSDAFGMDWTPVPGAEAYEFQLSQDAAFDEILLTLITPSSGWAPDKPLAAGTYFWRVRTVAADGARSAFFGPFQATKLADLPVITRKTLMTPDQYLLQRKDTTMLDVGGGPGNDNGSGSPRSNYKNRWDGPHVFSENLQLPSFSSNGYDNDYCVRASIAMIVNYYGGSLSEDRISYFMKEQNLASDKPTKGRPERDMGFGEGASVLPALAWALNIPHVDQVDYCPDPRSDANDKDYTCSTGDLNVPKHTITFAEVEALIDSGRVFADGKDGHVRVVDGYEILEDGTRRVEVYNPKPLGFHCDPSLCTGLYWQDFDDFAKDHISSYYVPLGVTPHPRSDEPSIWRDSDGDGVNDFDEIYRFHTDPFNPDTDGDWVNDKEDIANYVFDRYDKYNPHPADLGLLLFAPNTYGVELDTLRKEKDWDNDDDGIPDGCEDANQDGAYGFRNSNDVTGESSNFSALDHQPCRPPIYIVNPSWALPQDVGPYNDPNLLQINLLALLPDPMTPKPVYDASNFEVTIGGQTAAILSVEYSGAYHLLVQPPNQSGPGKYDLTVTWSDAQLGNKTSSDTEETAVVYESPPIQNPPTVNHSVMLALDSSSLMGSIDSRLALANAARLFADQWGAQDRLGLVTFGQGSPNVAVPLAQVEASGNQITLVKTAIDSLPGSGESALGAGLQTAQSQLDSLAGADDRLDIAVFSAGQPSVAPYPSELFSTQGGSLSAFAALPPDDACLCPGDIFSATQINALGMGGVQANFTSGLERVSDATHGGLGLTGTPLKLSAYLPDTLENRLASDFQYAAAHMRGEQRLLEAFGTTTGLNTETYPVQLDESDSIAFMANFASDGVGAFGVFRPDGSQVQPGDSGVIYRSDPTHQYYRISHPPSGTWHVQVRSSNNTFSTEYLALASANTAAKLYASDPVYRGGAAFVFNPDVHEPLFLGVVLADDTPIANATVKATVLSSDGNLVDQFELSDDGLHHDGAPGDGAYGAVFTPTLPGGYVIKYIASGNDNSGRAFLRYSQVDFSLPRSAAYLYSANDAPDTFTGYQDLLSKSSIPMQGIATNDISNTNWSKFSLIMIAPDSAGAGDHWMSASDRKVIDDSGLPILGMFYGGYDLFGDYGLNLGTQATLQGNLASTSPVNAADPVWSKPFPLPSASSYQLYNNTPAISLNLDPLPMEVTPIGQEPATTHLNIALEQRRYLLWGFEKGPNGMTEEGRRLFSNLLALLLP